MNNDFRIAVLGATALGCGIAFEGGGNVVLIDEGVDLAVDYTRTLRWMEPAESGGIISAELTRRGLVRRGVSTPALDAVMCGLLQKSGARMLLCCRPTSVKRTGHRFEVGYFGINGFRYVTCDHIIDTRAFSGERRFNLICARTEGAAELSCDGFEAYPGGFDTEGFLSRKCAPGTESPRLETLSLFENGLATLAKGWKIAAAAHEVDIRGETGLSESDGILSIQSAAYRNADIAFEEGRKCCTAVS